MGHLRNGVPDGWKKRREEQDTVDDILYSCDRVGSNSGDIKPGDEVIMPSYTFVSTADAFVLRGAKAVFVDIRPDTMNIDETLIEDAVTERTKAIVPVHYAGVSCEMDTICELQSGIICM